MKNDDEARWNKEFDRITDDDVIELWNQWKRLPEDEKASQIASVMTPGVSMSEEEIETVLADKLVGEEIERRMQRN